MSRDTDPVLEHSRREAIIIGAVWLASTIYCCAYCYLFGYRRPGRALGIEDLHSILGVPSWVVFGFLVPWLLCAGFTFWFAGFYMTDDDLGKDHAGELESDIREGGLHE